MGNYSSGAWILLQSSSTELHEYKYATISSDFSLSIPSASVYLHTLNSSIPNLIINMKLTLLSVGLLAGSVAAVPTRTSDTAAPIVKRASLDDVSFHIF